MLSSSLSAAAAKTTAASAASENNEWQEQQHQRHASPSSSSAAAAAAAMGADGSSSSSGGGNRGDCEHGGNDYSNTPSSSTRHDDDDDADKEPEGRMGFDGGSFEEEEEAPAPPPRYQCTVSNDHRLEGKSNAAAAAESPTSAAEQAVAAAASSKTTTTTIRTIGTATKPATSATSSPLPPPKPMPLANPHPGAIPTGPTATPSPPYHPPPPPPAHPQSKLVRLLQRRPSLLGRLELGQTGLFPQSLPQIGEALASKGNQLSPPPQHGSSGRAKRVLPFGKRDTSTTTVVQTAVGQPLVAAVQGPADLSFQPHEEEPCSSPKHEREDTSGRLAERSADTEEGSTVETANAEPSPMSSLQRRSRGRRHAHAIKGLRRINSLSSIYSLETLERPPKSRPASVHSQSSGESDEEPLAAIVNSQRFDTYRRTFNQGSLVRIRVQKMVQKRYEDRLAAILKSEDILAKHPIPNADADTDSEPDEKSTQPRRPRRLTSSGWGQYNSDTEAGTTAMDQSVPIPVDSGVAPSSPVQPETPHRPLSADLISKRMERQTLNDTEDAPKSDEDNSAHRPSRRSSRAHDNLLETFSHLVTELANLIPGVEQAVQKDDLKRNSVMNIDLLLAQFDEMRAAAKESDSDSDAADDGEIVSGEVANGLEHEHDDNTNPLDSVGVSPSVSSETKRRPQAISMVVCDRPEVVEVEFRRESDRMVTLKRGTQPRPHFDGATPSALRTELSSLSGPTTTIVEDFLFEHWVPDTAVASKNVATSRTIETNSSPLPVDLVMDESVQLAATKGDDIGATAPEAVVTAIETPSDPIHIDPPEDSSRVEIENSATPAAPESTISFTDSKEPAPSIGDPLVDDETVQPDVPVISENDAPSNSGAAFDSPTTPSAHMIPPPFWIPPPPPFPPGPLFQGFPTSPSAAAPFPYPFPFPPPLPGMLPPLFPPLPPGPLSPPLLLPPLPFPPLALPSAVPVLGPPAPSEAREPPPPQPVLKEQERESGHMVLARVTREITLDRKNQPASVKVAISLLGGERHSTRPRRTPDSATASKSDTTIRTLSAEAQSTMRSSAAATVAAAAAKGPEEHSSGPPPPRTPPLATSPSSQRTGVNPPARASKAFRVPRTLSPPPPPDDPSPSRPRRRWIGPRLWSTGNMRPVSPSAGARQDENGANEQRDPQTPPGPLLPASTLEPLFRRPLSPLGRSGTTTAAAAAAAATGRRASETSVAGAGGGGGGGRGRSATFSGAASTSSFSAAAAAADNSRESIGARGRLRGPREWKGEAPTGDAPHPQQQAQQQQQPTQQLPARAFMSSPSLPAPLPPKPTAAAAAGEGHSSPSRPATPPPNGEGRSRGWQRLKEGKLLRVVEALWTRT
ncbi:hypothetical protein DFJ73DRAFT_957590 [Zopfochytrium polystomum]|nr:hypothetical protein DFJ73DRAFT_957590 [Zopfochytrium polystomum]